MVVCDRNRTVDVEFRRRWCPRIASDADVRLFADLCPLGLVMKEGVQPGRSFMGAPFSGACWDFTSAGVGPYLYAYRPAGLRPLARFRRDGRDSVKPTTCTFSPILLCSYRPAGVSMANDRSAARNRQRPISVRFHLVGF